MPKNMEEICLKLDNGDSLRFMGCLFSESSDFDKESGFLTRQQLYITENGEQVYYITRSDGHERSRHAYKLAIDGDTCIINNGKMEIAMKFDMLMLAVRGLCGLEAGATPSLTEVEEFLQAANS